MLGFLIYDLSNLLQFYIGFTFLCRNKADCNEIHPYISFVPVCIPHWWPLLMSTSPLYNPPFLQINILF